MTDANFLSCPRPNNHEISERKNFIISNAFDLVEAITQLTEKIMFLVPELERTESCLGYVLKFHFGEQPIREALYKNDNLRLYSLFLPETPTPEYVIKKLDYIAQRFIQTLP